MPHKLSPSPPSPLPPLVLASRSPGRKAQLEELGYPFEVTPPPIDERKLEKAYSGKLSCLGVFLARKKAESLASCYPVHLIIGSDQVLIFEGQPYHQPKTLDEVVERLMKLQGSTHELHTGLCLHYQGVSRTSTTLASMTMKPLSLQQAKAYAQLDKPLGCAGGYRFEKGGKELFSKVQTKDPSAIVGLPCLSLKRGLKYGLASMEKRKIPKSSRL